jgi:dCMP deaminase
MKLEKSNKWDARFLGLCDMIASWSEDASRKVGSVVVGPLNEIRSTGYNGLPRGVDSSQNERHDRSSGEKYFWFEHAERNAIYNAASSGIATSGCRMYVNSFPCSDCTRAILQSGIIQLNTYAYDAGDEKFAKHFVVAETMLREAGVEVRLFSRDDEAIALQNRQFAALRDPKSGVLR